MVSDKSFITVQGWMRTELDLKGNDLLVYAIIFGFSQTKDQRFTGSLQYLADWCGATKQGIQKNLKNLIDRGLIIKVEDKVYNSVAYCTTELHSGVQLSCTNNISNTIDNTINKNNTEFIFGKKKENKESLYSKCIALINDKTQDDKCRVLLVDWLNMLLEKYRDRGRQLYVNVFKGKLNMLDTFPKSEWANVISFNLQRGYEGFYPVVGRKTINEGESVHSTAYTDEELDTLEKLDKERESLGMRVRF